jgi:hypothetical protein
MLVIGACPALGEEDLAKKYIKFFSPFLGDFALTHESAGKKTNLTWHVKKGTTGLAYYSWADGGAGEDALHYYDPGDQLWKVISVDAKGVHAFTYKADVKDHSQVTQGMAFPATVTHTAWDGKVVRETATLRVMKITPNADFPRNPKYCIINQHLTLIALITCIGSSKSSPQTQ